MADRSRSVRSLVGIVAITVLLLGCAAGDPRFTPSDPAGFWTGLWHGMISFITLVIGIFADSVHVYEVDNTGGWYDFGFLLGVAMIWGGGHSTYHHRTRKRREDDEWKEIGRKVEAKLQRKIREWAEAEPDEDWNVVEARAEAKLKQRLRAWAEEP